MLDRAQERQSDTCLRCGAGPERLVTQRVSGLERGYVRITQCQACGHSTHQSILDHAAKE